MIDRHLRGEQFCSVFADSLFNHRLCDTYHYHHHPQKCIIIIIGNHPSAGRLVCWRASGRVNWWVVDRTIRIIILCSWYYKSIKFLHSLVDFL